MQKQLLTFNNQQFSIYIRDEADQSVVAEIFKLREYRKAEDVIRRAQATIIDVGAHAGFFSLYVRALNPIVPVVAIEPEANNINLLEQHIKENNLSGITVVPGVLVEVSGQRTLVLSEDSHNHRLDSSGDAPGADNTSEVDAFSFNDLCKNVEVNEVSLVKLDIEGGEYEVFNGMDEDDFNRIGAIIMEYHAGAHQSPQNLEQLIREQGFSVQIFPSHFDKTMGFLFARNKKNAIL